MGVRALAIITFLSIGIAQCLSAECERPDGVLFFEDVDVESWYCQPVYDLVAIGLIDQQLNRRFRPDAEITREEFTKLLVLTKTNGESPPDPAEPPYLDVPVTRWSAPHINFAKEKGWISSENAFFNPSESILRAEIAVILSRIYCSGENQLRCSCPSTEGNPCELEPYADETLIPSWATEEVEKVRFRGLMTGTPIDGRQYFRPGEIARSEAAAILSRVLETRFPPETDYWADDSKNPKEVSVGSKVLALKNGLNYFKFDVEPGTDYSFELVSDSLVPKSYAGDGIPWHSMWTASDPQTVGAYSSETFDLPENTGQDNLMPGNISPARSALLISANQARTEFVTVHAANIGGGSDSLYRARIELERIEEKKYDLPFSRSSELPAAQRAYSTFYNSFHHRVPEFSRGHDGVDIAPTDAANQNNGDAAVLPIADGVVARIDAVNSYPGHIVWIYHQALLIFGLNEYFAPSALSNTDGAFSSVGLPEGHYIVEPFKEGYTFSPPAARLLLSSNNATEHIYFYGRREGGPGGTLDIDIDIKPGSDTNPINYASNGKIPLAILSSFDFDAPSVVDRPSLRFGRTGTEDSLHYRGNGEPNCSDDGDFNEDGLADLLCHFHTQVAGFQPGDTEGILTGLTFGGEQFEGRDTITIVGPHIFSSSFESGDFGDWTVVGQ